jgi:DNA (cytosine-5)-methyltransferase 1
MTHTFYEFFAGGGMASQGLGSRWRCSFANDIDPAKAKAYCANNDPRPFLLGDIAQIDSSQLPGRADLVWGSFPCQDLSLAGTGVGLKGERSGLFWSFWRLIKQLAREGRSPAIITLENVYGVITSHQGKDLAAIAKAFQKLGYCFGVCVLDAAHFVPQSRPRVFIVGVHSSIGIPGTLTSPDPIETWHPAALQRSLAAFGPKLRSNTIYWNLPAPPLRNIGLADIIESEPEGVEWNSRDYTRNLLSMMDANNTIKIAHAKKLGREIVGTIYRRTRPDGAGGKVQRAEVRFDDIAGCLRTPAGGSSRQTIIIVDGAKVRSRLISPREAARLMGLSDEYHIPKRYNEAYHLMGDGVAVPAVRFLDENIFQPLLKSERRMIAAE